MNLVLRDASGRIILHHRIFGAPVGKGPGPKINTDGTKWSYQAKGTSGGIEKASVALVQGTTFEVQVKGKASDFRVDTCDLRLEIVLGGDAEATAGLCTTRTFGTGGSKPGDLQPGNSRQGHCAA